MPLTNASDRHLHSLKQTNYFIISLHEAIHGEARSGGSQRRLLRRVPVLLRPVPVLSSPRSRRQVTRDFGAPFNFTLAGVRLVPVDHPQACGDIDNCDQLEGGVALIQRG